MTGICLRPADVGPGQGEKQGVGPNLRTKGSTIHGKFIDGLQKDMGDDNREYCMILMGDGN